MKRSDRRRRTVMIASLIVGTILFGGSFALWVLYMAFPTWFPGWFSTLFTTLAGVGVLITVIGAALSDIFLPLLDRLRSREPSRIWKLAERAPIRQLNYDTLVARLGQSGRIPWIDRGVTSSGLLRSHGWVAIVGWMKSGKTREAAELIRMALEDSWISTVYEPTSALDLIEQNIWAEAVTTEVDERQRCLFFIDELGLRPEPERLMRLSTCVQTICKVRPDSYFLITIQRERLTSTVQKWLEEHQFHHVALPALTAIQRQELARTAANILGVAITDGAVGALARQTDGRPYSIVFALQQASGDAPLDEASVQELLARSHEEAWAEQRRHIGDAEPAAEPLLESIVTFVSAGVTPRETSIRRYAHQLMALDLPTKKTRQLLDAAAERWSVFDIVATEGLYTIPEPLLLPLVVATDEARARLLNFVETYNPGPWVSLATIILRPLDMMPRLRLPRLPQFRRLGRLSSKLRTAVQGVRLPRFWDISPDPTRLTEALFSWPADRALLLRELGIQLKSEYFSSVALLQRGNRAFLDGDYAAALDSLEKALALNPDNVNAFKLRAFILLFKMKRYDDALQEALAALSRANESDPIYHIAYEQKGIALKELGHYEEAIEALSEAEHTGPSCPNCIAHRGEVYRRLECYKEALADFDRAIELWREYAWAIAGRGLTYQWMGHYEEALADFDQAIKLEPDGDWYFYNRALTYAALTQMDKVQADLRAAIRRAREVCEKQPQHWPNTLNLALYHLAAGETETGERVYREALSGGASPYHIRDAIHDLEDLLRGFPDHTQALAMRDLLQVHLQETER